MLPRPCANMKEYNRMMELRFESNPACKENYQKYQNIVGGGGTGNTAIICR